MNKEIKQLNKYSNKEGFSIVDYTDYAVINCSRCNLDIAIFGECGSPVEMLKEEIQHRKVCK